MFTRLKLSIEWTVLLFMHYFARRDMTCLDDSYKISKRNIKQCKMEKKTNRRSIPKNTLASPDETP